MKELIEYIWNMPVQNFVIILAIIGATFGIPFLLLVLSRYRKFKRMEREHDKSRSRMRRF